MLSHPCNNWYTAICISMCVKYLSGDVKLGCEASDWGSWQQYSRSVLEKDNTIYYRISFMTLNLKHHHATITNEMEKIWNSCVQSLSHADYWVFHDCWTSSKERLSPWRLIQNTSSQIHIPCCWTTLLCITKEMLVSIRLFLTISFPFLYHRTYYNITWL